MSVTKKTIRIGTRGSPLALSQVELVRTQLLKIKSNFVVEPVVVKTSGDIKQPLGEQIKRDKKDWILELEKALIDGRIDFAIHSGKDVPVDIEAETSLKPVLFREDPMDCFVVSGSLSARSIDEISSGAVIGTSSLRRAAQLRHARPDLQIVPCRGNVATRLARLENNSGFDAIVLAYAGMKRLGLQDKVTQVFSAEQFLPAMNQGILVAQYRKNDAVACELLGLLEVPDLVHTFLAERAVVAELKADCHSALAVYARVLPEGLRVIAQIFSHDGKELIEESLTGAPEEALNLGRNIAHKLFSKGAAKLLASHLA